MYLKCCFRNNSIQYSIYNIIIVRIVCIMSGNHNIRRQELSYSAYRLQYLRYNPAFIEPILVCYLHMAGSSPELQRPERL